MCLSRLTVLLLLSGNAWAAGEFVIAGGLEGDSADGLAGSVFGSVAVGDDTWLSGGVARTAVDLNPGDELRTWYADIGLDHYFEPFGVRVGAAYWGDDSILDSVDARGAVYLRGEHGSLSLDYEYRDFEIEFRRSDEFPNRRRRFHANGIGLNARVELGENADLSVGGIAYDYSVDLALDPNRDIIDFISVTRLSLVNSLVDYRASGSLGVDLGLKRLELDVAQWRGAVAGSRTNSYSVRFLTPIGKRSDIEFTLGFDDSENFGEVTVFSVYLYFYGGS